MATTVSTPPRQSERQELAEVARIALRELHVRLHTLNHTA